MSVKKKLQIICLIGLASIPLASFAKNESLTADVGFATLSNLPPGSNAINPIRLQAIEEASTTLGARGALAWRSLQINRTLQSEADYLDQVFNFNQILINGDVLPPVLTQANNNLTIDDKDALRSSSKIYKIVSPAQFVTTPPTWRDYLWMNYKKPQIPDHTLLPTTQAEATVWNAYLKIGWKEGIQQANEIFAVNLNRLKRDYTGMVLYKQLLDQHMVSAPFIAHANLGVTGDSQEIRINDNVSRITANSELQTNPNKWTPVITSSQ